MYDLSLYTYNINMIYIYIYISKVQRDFPEGRKPFTTPGNWPIDAPLRASTPLPKYI